MTFSFRMATAAESDQIKQIVQAQGRYIKDWESCPILLLCATLNRVIGWVRHWRLSGDRHAIMSLTVDEAFRGRELGLALVFQLIKQAVDTECWVLDCKASLRGYYARLGFVEMDRAMAPELLDETDDPDSICMTARRAEVLQTGGREIEAIR
ncbi:MAG: GNAT family N-acetyltransferase [Bdellovibrionales bacterium]